MHGDFELRPRVSGRSRWTALVVLVLLIVCASPALAGQVIPPGKEQTIRTMLEPYVLGSVVSDGFVLRDLKIERDRVVLSLYDETDATRSATLTLGPRQIGDPLGSVSFSFAFDGDDEARTAATVLTDSIRAHDHGDVYISSGDAPREPGPDHGEHVPASTDAAANADEPEPEAMQTWAPRERATYLAKVAALAGLFVGTMLLGRALMRDRLRAWDEALAGATMIAGLVATAAYAWTCADATISVRYASNLAAGHGLVFNLGERVQGFSNPLWTLGLAVGASWGGHLIWATNLALMCTAGALAWLWSSTRRLSLDASAVRFAAVVALTFACQPFLAFSTSGLENSMTHMLVAACLAAALAERPGLVVMTAALALLNRLDTAPLVGPLVVVAWWRSGATVRERFAACRIGWIGVVPLAAWFIFATIYYGYPLPNTWYVKGGLNGDMGLRYLGDFISRRPVSAIAMFTGPIAVLAWSKMPALRAAAIGVFLQVAYVVGVGGDYMHGRFFTAPLMLASVCLVAVSPPAIRSRRAVAVFIGALSLGTLIDFARVSSSATDRGDVFLIERDPEFAVWKRGPVEVGSIAHENFELDEVAISNHLIGQVFGSDLRIQWIDGYGLTDPYVARCPIIGEDPRPGHAERRIPRAYLRARGDVRQLPDGRTRLESGDATLGPELEIMRANPEWPSEVHRRRHEELELLTRGPIFDPARLRLIPSYVFGRNALPELEPDQAFDVLAPD